ncbi:MAG TPA: hypothetical protein VGR55_05085 [Candidatus Acidoferrum sp.]|nr:hypothetical protein [Candidatus Acidoferrum sp.]
MLKLPQPGQADEAWICLLQGVFLKIDREVVIPKSAATRNHGLTHTRSAIPPIITAADRELQTVKGERLKSNSEPSPLRFFFISGIVRAKPGLYLIDPKRQPLDDAYTRPSYSTTVSPAGPNAI